MWSPVGARYGSQLRIPGDGLSGFADPGSGGPGYLAWFDKTRCRDYLYPFDQVQARLVLHEIVSAADGSLYLMEGVQASAGGDGAQ